MSRRPTPEQAALLSEQAVADRLELDGWRILGVNVRTRFGELPIVARRGDMIVFVETTAPGPQPDPPHGNRVDGGESQPASRREPVPIRRCEREGRIARPARDRCVLTTNEPTRRDP